MTTFESRTAIENPSSAPARTSVTSPRPGRTSNAAAATTSAVESGSEYSASPRSTSHVPRSSVLPTTSASSGQSANRVAATSPTARLPLVQSPSRYVATTVTAFAASESASPNANATSGFSVRPSARYGRTGTLQTSGQPIVTAPGGRICSTSSVAIVATHAVPASASHGRSGGRRRQRVTTTAGPSNAAATPTAATPSRGTVASSSRIAE